MRIDLGAWALLLVAIGIGYFVCLKASKEGTKLFKYGGYVIGIIILAVSLSLAVSDLGSRIGRYRRTIQRRSRRMSTKPTIRQKAKTPEQPESPRRDVGVTEPEEVVLHPTE